MVDHLPRARKVESSTGRKRVIENRKSEYLETSLIWWNSEVSISPNALPKFNFYGNEKVSLSRITRINSEKIFNLEQRLSEKNGMFGSPLIGEHYYRALEG